MSKGRKPGEVEGGPSETSLVGTRKVAILGPLWQGGTARSTVALPVRNKDVQDNHDKDAMVTSLCLLTCALTLGQTGAKAEWQLTPQLSPGTELVYSGVYQEETLIPHVQFQRQYRLDATMLVLEANAKSTEIGLMTALSLIDNRQVPEKNAGGPTSIRLERGRIDAAGRFFGGDNKAWSIALMGPPTLEHGFLVDAPPGRVGKDAVWEVSEEDRTPRTWQVVGTESTGGYTCVKIVGLQQSEDWDRPRGDRTAWRRKDTLWLHPQLHVAQKVERVVERRDPARQVPTQRATIRYELESRLKYPGRFFEDRRTEITQFDKFRVDAQPLLRQPAQHTAQIEAMLGKVKQQLETPSATPYRKAFVHLQATLERAKRGEAMVGGGGDEPVAMVKTVERGQRVPDFVVSSLTERETTRFQRLLGKPILVVFYNPANKSGREIVAFAKKLADTHGKNLSIMAMAVTNDAELARKQHTELKLPFPILDGQGMRLTFGAEQTPRFVLLDSEGIMRTAFTGWGYQTPDEITEELQRCFKK
jgi:peroxiredoxin